MDLNALKVELIGAIAAARSKGEIEAAVAQLLPRRVPSTLGGSLGGPAQPPALSPAPLDAPFALATSSPSRSLQPLEEEPPRHRRGGGASDDPVPAALSQLRKALRRHGAKGIVGLGRKFRLLTHGRETLNYRHFQQAIVQLDVGDPPLDQGTIRALFKAFDHNSDGQITYNEFLVELRGRLSSRRERIVRLAFNTMDADRDGVVTISDIFPRFDANWHPGVKAGERSTKEVIREFLDTFDGQDGVLTVEEFEHYYAVLSASIDDDDYFELVVRNAWHISGGEGWCANTTNRRVLVEHEDGHETVEEIRNDLGIRSSDSTAMAQALSENGIKDLHSVALAWGSEARSVGGSLNVPPGGPARPAAGVASGTPAPGVTASPPAAGRKAYASTTSSISFGTDAQAGAAPARYRRAAAPAQGDQVDPLSRSTPNLTRAAGRRQLAGSPTTSSIVFG